ncbi:MAG: ABC transporter ATP-binding protein [Myxococcota bacterium]
MALIAFRQVSRSFPRPNRMPFPALTDVSFAIAPGQFTAVIGRSGSGKSTLLHLMAGLDRPTSGEVEVAGERIDDLDETTLARWRGANVGIVFQFFQLLPTLTVRENVLLAMEFGRSIARADRHARSADLLERVGVLDQADKLPAALSGGQQQRAAIARALANRPSILVADEPTGNLDSKSGRQIVELFRQLVDDDVTVVVVTHDPAVADEAAVRLQLEDGRLASVKEPAALA